MAKPKNDYKNILVIFMDFIHDAEHEYDYQVTSQELCTITPQDVKWFFCLKAFGNPDPPADANPMHCRCSTLEYYKKALSSYMPNCLSPWNALAMSGNPTRSIEVNDLIKKNEEKRGQKGRGTITGLPIN